MNAIEQFYFIECNAYEGVMGDISLDSSHMPDEQGMALEHALTIKAYQSLDGGGLGSKYSADFIPIYLDASNEIFQPIN